MKPGTEVRYRYDSTGGLNSWIPMGNPANFLTVDPVQTNSETSAMNRTDVLNDIRTALRATKLGSIDNGAHIYAPNSKMRAQPAFKDFRLRYGLTIATCSSSRKRLMAESFDTLRNCSTVP